VFIFLGSLRKTLIISLTIPLCTLAAAAAMKFSGFSLNIFSLAGLAISVGQAVDTSVVILENIDHRAAQAGSFHPSKEIEPLDAVASETSSLNGSESPNGLESPNGSESPNGVAETANTEVDEVDDRPSYRQRIRQMNALVTTSSREVESSLVAATAANLVSVMPFVLIGGFISLLFNELIWTICFAVAASLLVALTVVPVLAARLMAIPWSSNLGNFWPLQQFNRRFNDATHLYRRALAWVLPRRLLFVLVTLLLLGGSSWWLVGQVPQELLPRTNTGQVNVTANFPPGTSLANNRKVMSAVEEIVQRQPETAATFFTSGGSLFGGGTSRNPLRSNGTIVLKPNSDIDAYIAKATKAVQRLNLAGIRVRINRGQVRGISFNNSPLRSADVDVVLRGNQPRLLARTGRELLQVLEDNVTLANFRPDADARQPEVQVIPDWERVTALGLNAQQIGETVQTAIQGFVPTQLQRGDRLVDVRVQLAAADRQRPGQLAQLPLFSTGSPAVRLGDVAEISWGEAPGDIQRINQQQVFMIAGNLNQGANLSKAIKQVEAAVAQVELPAGITLLPSAAAQSNRQVQDSVVLLGLLATFLVFVVLAVQYNSLLDPLVIMLTVPLALTGSFLGLYVTQTALGATVIVGAVLLVGIVVNNAILLLELANEIVETEHCSRFDAILKAAPQRLRPIMMTLITTILGIFPLALGLGEGSEFLRPLGIVVFWGMTGATFLTLFLIPCFYVIIHGLDPLQRKKQKPKKLQKAEVNVG
jgi:multidrug efflux pump subunit AcrB